MHVNVLSKYFINIYLQGHIQYIFSMICFHTESMLSENATSFILSLSSNGTVRFWNTTTFYHIKTSRYQFKWNPLTTNYYDSQAIGDTPSLYFSRVKAVTDSADKFLWWPQSMHNNDIRYAINMTKENCIDPLKYLRDTFAIPFA